MNPACGRAGAASVDQVGPGDAVDDECGVDPAARFREPRRAGPVEGRSELDSLVERRDESVVDLGDAGSLVVFGAHHVLQGVDERDNKPPLSGRQCPDTFDAKISATFVYTLDLSAAAKYAR